MIGIDTNVIVRYVVRDDRTQAAQADRLLERRTGDDPVFICAIVLAELVWVLRRAYGYDCTAVSDVIDQILGTEAIRVEAYDAAVAALEVYRMGRADFADCLIGRLNRDAGCSTTVTFDENAAALAEFSQL